MKRILVFASLAILLCQCDKPASNGEEGGQADGYVEISFSADNGSGTKTSISKSDNKLSINWVAGDTLYVAGSADGYLGIVTAQSVSGKSATFKGKILTWSSTQNLHFYYLGKGNKNFADYASSYDLNISNQDGTLATIAAKYQPMHAVAENIASPDAGSFTLPENLTMKSMVGIGLFDLTTSSGFSGESSVKLKGAYSSATINLTTGGLTGTKNDITLSTPSASYYVALIPDPASGNDTSAVSFVQNSSTIDFSSSKRLAATFYSDSGNAIKVEESLPLYGDTGLPGIKVGNTIWAPVNCGYDATNYKYGKLYQWGRKYGCGYVATDATATYNDLGGVIQTTKTAFDTQITNPEQDDSLNFYRIEVAEGLIYSWLKPHNTTLWNSGTENAPQKTEYDPCPKGWRVPTTEEWKLLISYDTNDASTLYENAQTGTGVHNGMKGSYLNGCRNPVPNSGVFLPLSGTRNNYGDAELRENTGFYSSSKSDYTSCGVIEISSNRITLYQYGSGCIPMGQSVRCVHE